MQETNQAIAVQPSIALINRRSLLKSAALIFAEQSLPSWAYAAAQPVSEPMATLSNYMAAAKDHELPENIAELVKQHVLDTFAAMISGSRLTPGAEALKFAQEYKTDGPCSIAVSAMQCGAMEAALTNGMLSHSDETDDSHSPSLSHPGCSVIPAALAAGEQFSIEGSHFLRAVALGYDIGPRMTMTLGGVQYQTNSHRSSHAIAGAFGAAAAAGCCASLDGQQMRWLLDYTAQQVSGIAAWQLDTEHIEKAFVFAGMPARSGVTAALLVQSGWTGVNDIFSGPDNFLAAFAPAANANGLVSQLGHLYEVQRTNIKKWSVGSPIQAPLDALEMIITQHSIHADDVKSVVVQVAEQEASVVNNRSMPDVCLQYLMAVLLMDGTVSFHAAHDGGRMSDAATMKQRNKVELVPSPELERQLPRREAIVDVTLFDQRRFTQRIDDVRGTYQNPMTWDEVARKSRDLIEPVLGALKYQSLLKKVRTIESCGNVREIGRLLQT